MNGLKDKTEQIIKAAIQVFVKKGFLQATTQDIAKEAKVAEITLYRKFSTKQNLFESVIKNVIEKKIHMKIDSYKELSTEEFFYKLLDDRLDTLTRNKALIKMLLSESLSGHIPNEQKFPNLVYNSLKKGLQDHFNKHVAQGDPELIAQQMIGILLSQVIFDSEPLYYKMTRNEQEERLAYYVNSLKANIKKTRFS